MPPPTRRLVLLDADLYARNTVKIYINMKEAIKEKLFRPFAVTFSRYIALMRILDAQTC